MFGKIKKALGIEGVKMELKVPNTIAKGKKGKNKVEGKLKFTSLSNQVVERMEVKMIERYARGRKESRLIDEYVVGSIQLADPVDIKPNQIIEVDFELEYELSKSEMDRIAESNIFNRGIVKMAKYLKKVTSEYRIEATAVVRGTKLGPTAKIPIILK